MHIKAKIYYKPIVIFLRFCLFERKAETQAEGEAESPMWDSIPGPRVMTWAKGRRSTPEPPRGPKLIIIFKCGICEGRN